MFLLCASSAQVSTVMTEFEQGIHCAIYINNMSIGNSLFSWVSLMGWEHISNVFNLYVHLVIQKMPLSKVTFRTVPLYIFTVQINYFPIESLSFTTGVQQIGAYFVIDWCKTRQEDPLKHFQQQTCSHNNRREEDSALAQNFKEMYDNL